MRVAASPEIAYAAARDLDLQRSPLVRAIFRGRELIMRSEHVEPEARSTFLAQAQRLGRRVLAEVPGRAIVLGAATRPWEANVRFEGLPPDAFARFHAPRYVKIVWSFTIEPLSPGHSLVRTDTRVVTTDDYARTRFRRYWAVFSPGIQLIRHEALRLVKRDAERRAGARTGEPAR
jgi:hypothetical protein